MWISTRFGGLCIFDKGKYKFVHYKKIKYDENSLSNNNVTSFAEDEYGNIWIGTDGGGLNFLNRGTNNFSHLMFDPDNPEGLTNNKVLALHLASDGLIWIGMWGGGVNVYNPNTGKFKHFVYDPDDESFESESSLVLALSAGLVSLPKLEPLPVLPSPSSGLSLSSPVSSRSRIEYTLFLSASAIRM